ncbi:MAG: hypothetical protein RR290_03455 [Clostridia bacterium]
MKDRKKVSGISLIVLVVTIIVIIILAGAVILSLTSNNPINEANQASFKSNVDNYNSEFNLYVASQFSKTNGTFDVATITKTVWDGNSANIAGTVKEVIASMTAKDGKNFKIEKGVFGYCGTDLNEKKWAQELNMTIF